jgi:hypothetical protein
MTSAPYGGDLPEPFPPECSGPSRVAEGLHVGEGRTNVSVVPEGWTWDETLYAGSAPYYERGRLPYPPAMADVLARSLGARRGEFERDLRALLEVESPAGRFSERLLDAELLIWRKPGADPPG